MADSGLCGIFDLFDACEVEGSAVVRMRGVRMKQMSCLGWFEESIH